MLSSLRYTLRLTRIGWILARHDALFPLRAMGIAPTLTSCLRLIARPARGLSQGARLTLALEALGPSFIKAGQAASTRPDLIGEDVAAELARLRDKLPAFASSTARAIIEEQLGQPIDALFASFEETPVAAASIAQVHYAVTPEGREVAVKILRPGIEAQFARDIALMRWLARILNTRRPHLAKRLKPLAVVDTFERMVQIELDLRYEAAAATELRDNMQRDARYVVPAVDWQRTARRVMTLDRIEGISLGDVEAVRAAFPDTAPIVRTAAEAFFNQVFRDGFFHADMHPGNLFVLRDGRLGVVDFGIMGRIDRESQRFLAEVLWGFLREDYQHVAQVHVDYGYCPRHIDVAQLAQACRAVGRPIMGRAMRDISIGALLGQLLQVARDFEMEAQPHLLLLQKTMVTAEGMGRNLNPNENMWTLSEPLIAAWARKNLGPKARLRDAAKQGAQALHALPKLLHNMQHCVTEHGLQLAPESLAALNAQRARHQRAWLRVAWAGVAALTLLAGILAWDILDIAL